MIKRKFNREFLVKIIILVLLSVGAVIMVFPFVWMALSSFKSTSEILAFPPTWLPSKPTLAAYRTILWGKLIFGRVDIGVWYKNSLIVTSTVTLLALVGSSLTGFVFAKYRFRGRDLIFLGILSTMMIPFEVKLIPLYKLAVDLKLNNTYFGLMIPSLTSTFGIFLMRQFITLIPDELIDAATIDGCSNLGIYWHVILPMVKPALGALAIFTFMWNWDMFLWPLVLIDKRSLYTIPLGLGSFLISGYSTNYDLFMAATMLTTLPVIAVFLVAQKQIVKGIALTGFK